MKNIFNNKGLTAYVLIFFIAFNFSELHAATGKKTDLPGIIKTADLIVMGVFSRVDVKWRSNKIFTTGVFEIKNVLKGVDVKSVLVEYVGGTAQHPVLKAPITLKVTNEAEFVPNEELVLVLKKISGNKYRIMGSQGKFTVTLDSEKKQKTVSGIEKIHGRSANDENHVVMSSEPMTIDEFTQYVNGFLDEIK